MIATDKPPLEEAYLTHISMKPWSEYSSSDYTPEQWHKACLIHQHQGAPTSKNQCKLPVRTPNGAINRNGVHAAAAALAGARGGVDASDAEKASARTALVRLYGELGEDAPAGLAKHSDMDPNEFLEHVGIKGMRWGVRKAEPSGGSSESSGQKQGMSTKKKVAIGAGIIVGAAATAYLLNSFGGRQIAGNSILTRAAKAEKAIDGNDLLIRSRVDSGKASHSRIMGLLRNKKVELDNAASLQRIDQLLKQPPKRMPTAAKLISADRRQSRIASVRAMFQRKPQTPLQLYPAQSMFRARNTKVTDMGDINSSLMRFTDDALRRGGA